MSRFYDVELPRVTQSIVPEDHSSNVAQDMSTAVFKRFTNLRSTRQYSTGTDGLSGCTTMYIISRRGVYVTHSWESVSFAPNNEWRDPPTQTDQELFQKTVLDALKDGGKFHPKLDRDAIEDDYIRAYIIRPKQDVRRESRGCWVHRAGKRHSNHRRAACTEATR
jgi:hypothetical protein